MDLTDFSTDQAIRSVRNEMARTVEDVLARRTRVLFLDPQRAVELARPVAEVMAKELGRDENWIEKQVEDFEKVAERYMLS